MIGPDVPGGCSEDFGVSGSCFLEFPSLATVDSNPSVSSIPISTACRKDRPRSAPLGSTSPPPPGTAAATPVGDLANRSLRSRNSFPLKTLYGSPVIKTGLPSPSLMHPTRRRPPKVDTAPNSLPEQPPFLSSSPALHAKVGVIYPEHHYDKVNMILREISSLAIMTATEESAASTTRLEPYAHDGNEMHLTRPPYSSTEDATAPEILGRLASMAPTQKSDPVQSLEVPGERWFVESALLENRGHIRRTLESQMLDTSQPTQGWISDIVGSGPAALRDVEHRGYSAHLDYEHVGGINCIKSVVLKNPLTMNSASALRQCCPEKARRKPCTNVSSHQDSP